MRSFRDDIGRRRRHHRTRQRPPGSCRRARPDRADRRRSRPSSSPRRGCANSSRSWRSHANMVVSTDRIIDVMWPGDDEAHALRTLRTNVWRLRSLMGAHADTTLLTRQGGYVLVLADDDHDAERFGALAAQGASELGAGDASSALDTFDVALGLWRGRAYEGYETEEWARPTAVRLEDMRTTRGRTPCRGDAAARPDRRSRHRTGPHWCRSTPCESGLAPCTCGPCTAINDRRRRYAPTPTSARRSPRSSGSNHRRNCASSNGPSSTTISAPMVASPPVAVARGYELFEAIATTPVTVTYRATAPRTAEPVLADRGRSCRRVRSRPTCGSSRPRHNGCGRSHSHTSWPSPTAGATAQGAYFVTPAGPDADPFRESSVDATTFVSLVGQLIAAVQHLHVERPDPRPTRRDIIHVDRDGGADRAAGRAGAAGLRGASTAIDQRSLAAWLASIAPRDLGAPARAVIDRGASRDADEQFDSVQAFGDALIAAITGESSDRASRATRNPYVGLRSFQESDAEVFFGRRRLVKEMLTRLANRASRGRLVAVIGASGSGKSSVVQAGLVPALRDGGVDDSVEWFVARMTPGDDPFASCRSALDAVASRPLEPLDDDARPGGDLLAALRCHSLPRDATLAVGHRSVRGAVRRNGESRRPRRVRRHDHRGGDRHDRQRFASCSRCAPTSTTARCSTRASGSCFTNARWWSPHRRMTTCWRRSRVRPNSPEWSSSAGLVRVARPRLRAERLAATTATRARRTERPS